MAKEIENKNVEETKDKEQIAKETKKNNKFSGIDISSLPDPEEEPIDEMPATMRTLCMAEPYIQEIYKNIFIPMGLTEETGLVQIHPADESNEMTLCWDTVNLSLEQEDEELFEQETIAKVSLIEALLYSRFKDGLMPNARDINNNRFRILDDNNPVILQSFELVVDLNNKDVESAINLIKDSIKLPPNEESQIFISKRPASQDTSGFGTPKASIIICNRSEQEMRNLSTAYKTERFGRKVNKAINRSSQTVYGTAKMIGKDIMNPAADVLGATVGTLAGATAQSMGIAVVESANEFRKSFDINAIKNRTSTQELVQAFTKGKAKSTRGGSF